MVLRINQSDANLLCDMTNKMQLYYMTCIFMVQDRVFTLRAVVMSVVILLLDHLRKKRSMPLNSQVLRFKNSCGTPGENC